MTGAERELLRELTAAIRELRAEIAEFRRRVGTTQVIPGGGGVSWDYFFLTDTGESCPTVRSEQ